MFRDFSIPEMMLRLFALLIALTVHEYCHGLAAYRLGDPTAKMNGRLTLNPLSHLDPIGTLMIIFGWFGWAKPVPVNPYNLHNPKRDMMLISFAGPLANLVTAILLGIVFRLTAAALLAADALTLQNLFLTVLSYIIFINILLAIFNLIPIPPLDGSHILEGLLPPRYAYIADWLRRYGFFLLIALILTRAVSVIFIVGVPLYGLFAGRFGIEFLSRALRI